MKIIIPITEAQSIIAGSIGSSVNPVDVTIEMPAPAVGGAGQNYVEAICRIRSEFPRYEGDQKIAAIKRLRELTGIGLAEAKWAVERTNAAIDCYIRTGKVLQNSF